MKSIAGMLRLDLAQYRELEAFAKFGSDLDQATQDQLTKGRVMMEIIKQKQYTPLAVEKQIAIIFVGTEGFLNDLSADKIADFEDGFLSYLNENNNDLLKEIKDTGNLSDDIKAGLKKATDEYLTVFAG
jgi:F-type H+-transporting ATPase subunit alpha